MDQKISISYLEIGMYVSDLDRPWIDTPFLLEGFHVQTEKEITTLSRYCSFVYIDPSRGRAQANNVIKSTNSKIQHYLERFLQGGKKKTEYEIKTSTKKELPKVKVAVENATKSIVNIMKNIKRGEDIHFDNIEQVVDPIIDSVIRNPEAYVWLSMMKGVDEYSYRHSINNCALAIVFGRHLGIPKEELKILAVGLLMMNAGNIFIPEEILNKPGALSDGEYKLVQTHVKHSVDIIKKIKGMPRDVINIALTHHERFDGSGYPSGLTGTRIPVYGRIAAIIDCYGALTTSTCYKTAKSPYSSLQSMYNWRGTSFQSELIEQFLQCMGVYPTGTIVEMTNGVVAIVISQNATQRMRPKIMLLIDENKKHLLEYTTVDLVKEYKDSSGYPLNIRRGLDPEECGIDPTEYYL